MTGGGSFDGIDRRTYIKCAALLGGAGAASLSGYTQQEWENTLELMHGWTGGDGAEAVDALESAFEEEYPDMDTDFRAIGGTGNVNLDQAVAQRLRDGEPPSLFAGWPGPNLQQYEGVLGDIEADVWDEAGLKDAHAGEVVEACQFGDGFSAVPIGSHRMNDLFYNVEVVEEAGVDPQDIDSFDAWVDALDAVASETDAVPYANSLSTWTVLQFWAVNMLGTQGFDAYMNFIEGEGDEEAVRAAFENAETVLSEYLNDDAPEIDFTEANQRIMSGDAAFIHQGNWAAGAYVTEDLTFGEDWDRIQYPGTEEMYGFHLDSFIYPGNQLDNPSPEESKAFLRFAGGQDAQVAFNQYKGSIPTREVPTDAFSPYLTETIEDFAEAEQRPPTLAHGLAVTQDVQSDLEDALADTFVDPYDVDAATQRFMEIV
ncbi:ABC transporter substrate-binding protein [Halorussus salilacus]|uniref:ABC transporter substrate-binding protein n=1 Tax=Halorussus salilacus TaxID=2953750 RepID=UPI00209C97D1|nr:ABC transporter substrate-binding protein [Halorussus salilacus]USZ68582.1 ABC transporter substrate-binding protein [Halorussus salilacus]